MKRPLAIVAFLYTAGILLARFSVPLSVLHGIAFLLLIPAFVLPRWRLYFLCPVLILAGWINLAQKEAILSPNDIRKLAGTNEAIVTIRGKLSETPYHRLHKENDQDVWTSMARVELTGLQFNRGDWQPVLGSVLVNLKEMLPDNYFRGQIVEIAGVLHPARGPVAEGLFDYREYLRQQGIHYQLRTDSAADWQIISSPKSRPLEDRFTAWAKKALALGLPAEDQTLHLEWALTLGWKAALTQEVSEPFIRASTYHIFAVDGLRIAIVSGIFFVLLRMSRVPRTICGLLVIPALLFYAALTGWPASAVRAIVMVIVVYIGWALKRPGDMLNSLFAAALILMVLDPNQLFQAGFQLSFFVVLCIILIWPFFDQLTLRLLRHDPLLPEELVPKWQRWLKVPAHYLLDLFFTSVVAWLGSIPLAAYYFHIITPMSGPANVPAVPLCALVLIANLCSLLLAGWFPWAAELFNHAGWFLMQAIEHTSQWSANWPAAYYYVPVPSLFTIIVYYVLLLAIFTGWLFQKGQRKWRVVGVALLAISWCVVCVVQNPSATQVTILPMNGGHAVFAKTSADRKTWLIDTGNKLSVEMLVKPYLQAQGVNRLDHLLLSHGEVAYSGGAEQVTELFSPHLVYTSPIRFRSPDYVNYLKILESTRRRHENISCGNQIGDWTVLYPPGTATFTRANDNAMVLRGDFGSARLLLLSDLGGLGQNALLERTNELRADIVVAGLPNEGEPLNELLIDAIHPKVIIIADADFPAHKRAGRKLQQRLAAKGIPIIYTRNAEAVTLAFTARDWELSAMDGTHISSQKLARP